MPTENDPYIRALDDLLDAARERLSDGALWELSQLIDQLKADYVGRLNE